MPIYEYKCENGHVFDVMQRMSEDPLAQCVECGAPVRKLLQPVGISFKGSGFYSTDYSKKGPKQEPKETVKSDAPDGASGSAHSGGEKKSETAPAGAAEKGD